MSTKVNIEVDAGTAELLEARAKARGMSVADLLADLAGSESSLPPELEALRARGEGPWAPDLLAEDARRLAEFRRTREALPWGEVKDWIRSWGAPPEMSPPKPRKL